MMAAVFVGLAVSGSRSGILLGMLALALSTAMIWSPAASRRSSRGRRSLLAALGAVLIIGQFGMAGLLRIAETDPLTDYRTQITRVTLAAAPDYLPLGSGFGTFEAVYTMHETPATMLSEYVNHAHNDWLELWLEGGFPAALLMAAFVVLFLWQAVRVWNPKGLYAPHVLPRAASIGVLVLLLHSAVEYPLRMPALAGVFALLLAVMLSSAPPEVSSSKRRRHRENDVSPEPHVPTAATKPPVFSMRGDGESDNKRLRR
jgi:O-antigen ligase